MKKALAAEGIVIAALVVAIICILTVLPRERVKDELTYKTEELLNENSYFTENEGADLPNDYSCDMYNSEDEDFVSADTLLSMTGEIINERNYLSVSDIFTYAGGESEYRISVSGDRYTVSVTSADEGISSDFTFEFDGTNNIYYVGSDPISTGKIIYSGTSSVEDVHVPEYDKYGTSNTKEYKEQIAQSIADEQLAQSEYSLVTVTVLDGFEWDRSNIGYISVLVNYDNEEFTVTAAYYSGGEWRLEKANYLSDYTENEEYAERCMKCKAAQAYASRDYSYLNEEGIHSLIENDIIWMRYLYGTFSFKSEHEPQKVQTSNRTYWELAIANYDDDRFDISEIQDAFGVELVLKEDGHYYECPFTSIADLKKYMNETYSSQYLDTLINRYTDNSDLIEYEDSLYLTDSGGVYRDRVPVEVTVTGNSDSTVNFSVKYDLMFIDEDFL